MGAFVEFTALFSLRNAAKLIECVRAAVMENWEKHADQNSLPAPLFSSGMFLGSAPLLVQVLATYETISVLRHTTSKRDNEGRDRARASVLLPFQQHTLVLEAACRITKSFLCEAVVNVVKSLFVLTHWLSTKSDRDATRKVIGP